MNSWKIIELSWRTSDGFFDDSPSGPFDPYLKTAPEGRNGFKGRQLLAGPGNDTFEKFKRIFTGEVAQSAEAKKGVEKTRGRGREMLPPSPAKWHSTPNDWFGCIGKPPDYFSPEVRGSDDTKGKKKKELPTPANFKIKPNPLGGPGYVNICINPYPKHTSEPYDFPKERDKKGVKSVSNRKFLSTSAPLDYFPPNPYHDLKPGPTYVNPEEEKSKSTGPIKPRFYVPFPKHPGGQHAGCFSKFPGFLNDPYVGPIKDKKMTGPKFLAASPNARSKYTTSAINQITSVSCNAKNYRVYRERVYPLPRLSSIL